jgi:hypothetical protein
MVSQTRMVLTVSLNGEEHFCDAAIQGSPRAAGRTGARRWFQRLQRNLTSRLGLGCRRRRGACTAYSLMLTISDGSATAATTA